VALDSRIGRRLAAAFASLHTTNDVCRNSTTCDPIEAWLRSLQFGQTFVGVPARNVFCCPGGAAMRRDITTAWLTTVLATLLVFATTASAQTCGNGVVEVGEECDPPGAESCTNFMDDDADGLVDCQDSDCLPEAVGAMVVCGSQCRAVPACQPLLDDPAKIKFRMPTRLDKLFLYGRAAPSRELDVFNSPCGFMIGNNYGVIYSSPWIMGYEMKYNTAQTKFVYRAKYDGTPKIRYFMIKKFMNYVTGLPEYFLKIKLEADLQAANPIESVYTEEDLSQMFSMYQVGDAPFYINAAWERRNYGWYLSDMTMSTWY